MSKRPILTARMIPEPLNNQHPAARGAKRPSLWVVRVASRLGHPGIMHEVSLVSKLPILISCMIPGMLIVMHSIDIYY